MQTPVAPRTQPTKSPRKPTPPAVSTTVRELVLSAHDYATLLANVCTAVGQVFGQKVTSATLLSSEPDHPRLRVRIDRRGDALFRGRAMAEDHTLEEHVLNLRGGALVADPAGHLRALGLPVPEHLPQSLAYFGVGADRRSGAAIIVELPHRVSGATPSQRRALNGIQSAAEIVLPACREVDQLRALKDTMQEIFEAATMLEGSDDARLVARSACQVMCERLGFDRALLVQVTHRGDELVGCSSFGMGDYHIGLRMLVSDQDSLIPRVFREATVAWLPEASADPLGHTAGGSPSHHAVALPLLVNGVATGVLFADHRQNRAQVSPTRLVTLQLFANTVAARLEAASLLAQVARLAELDGLTGLANRRSFDLTLRREVARAKRHGSPLSLLMIDINDFKALNDTLGHLAGDEILVGTAKLLCDCVREIDFVARYGGDEFVILMPGTDLRAAQVVRDRIQSAIESPNNGLSRPRWQFSLSFGLRSAAGEEADSLLERADAALYAHKEAQARRALLDVLLNASEDEIAHWNHYIGKLLCVLSEKEPGYIRRARGIARACRAIAQMLHLRPDQTDAVTLAAMLHDVGKISVPARTLQHDGPLTGEEVRRVRAHPVVGDELLREVDHMGEVCEIIRSHHERFDGRTDAPFPAYPGELTGEDIPIGARILKVVESFHAMTSDRPYRKPMPTAEALRFLDSESGKAFDPDVVRVFTRWLESEEAAQSSRPLG